MTESEKLTLLKTMVDDSTPDTTLKAYLLLAGKKIIRRAYPFDRTIEIVPSEYATLQCEIAAYMLGKRGAEGQTAHSENGISRSYENGDVPESMLSVVVPNVGYM